MIKSRETRAARAFSSRPIGQAAAVTLLAATLSLAACGGSDDDPTPAPPSGTPLPPAPPAPPAAGSVTAQDACQPFADATGAAVTGTVAGKVANPSNVALTYTAVSQPARGTVSMQANGAFTYTPTVVSRGAAETFRYRVTGGDGSSSEANATIVYGTPRIMPLGDSITEGVETVINNVAGPASPSRVAYRRQLVTSLTAGGYPFQLVGDFTNGTAAGLSVENARHEGWGGKSTAFIANGDSSQPEAVGGITAWLTRHRPDVVLLHAGTNDVNGSGGVPPSTSAAAIGDTLAKINTWSSTAGNQPVRVLLARIIPFRAGTPNEALVSTFNSNVDAVYNGTYASTPLGGPLTVRQVDMFTALNSVTDLSPVDQDSTGLHPNAGGYAKMGTRWYERLVAEKFVNKCP